MSADGASLSFGIKTSQAGLSYDEIVRVWREADQVPEFEHAWLWDHLVPLRGEVTDPALEAWTLLAALAAQTKRLRLGVIVTSNRLRQPTLLAKMAATVDIISGGRLEFGIGAGGSRVPDPQALAFVHREYDAYGVDVVAPSEALAALDEACHKSAVLDEHCRAIGRDPNEIARSIQVLVSAQAQEERPAHLPPVRGP